MRVRKHWKWVALLGGVAAVIGLSAMKYPMFYSENARWMSQPTLSSQQMRKIGAAISQYEKSHEGRRPEKLADLVDAKLLTENDLLDAERQGRFASTSQPAADAIYLPAVRKTDPGDLVILHTIVTHERGEKLLAVLNNGELVECTPRELVERLNRTYEYIASEIEKTRQAPSPPASAGPLP